MRQYLKILFITAMIQAGALQLGFILYNLPMHTDILRSIGLVLFVANAPVSLLVGIILAIKWGNSLKRKLLYIFLMPTNYTWIIYLAAVNNLLNKIINILTGLPDNFG